MTEYSFAKYSFVKEWHRRRCLETSPAGKFEGELADAAFAAAKLVDPIDAWDQWSQIHVFENETYIGSIGYRWCYDMKTLITGSSPSMALSYLKK